MTRNRGSLMVLLALILAGTLGAWGYMRSRSRATYQTALVERGDIASTISATGTINAVVTVQVGSQVSGNIKALFADFNTKVTKGQVVALIDPQLFEARVKQARGTLDNARAAVVSAQAQQAKTEADVATAQAAAEIQKAGVARAKVTVLDAQNKLGRRLVLFDQGIIGKEERDSAQATYDAAVAERSAAESQFEAALKGVAAAEAQRRVIQTQLAAAQAQVRQAEAALEQAETDLAHTEIHAPVDGTVVARRMDVGQTVAASFQAPTIFEIAQDLAKMQVDTNVDEADIGRVRMGQRATFTVDAYPGAVFRSTVTQIRRAPINAQNVITYDVVLSADNPELKLFPGMTANVRILADQQKDVLKVPNAALRFHPAGEAPARATYRQQPERDRRQNVYVLEADGTPRPVAVKVGLSDGTYSSVEPGAVNEGMRVVIAAVSRNGPAPTAGNGPRMRGPGF